MRIFRASAVSATVAFRLPAHVAGFIYFPSSKRLEKNTKWLKSGYIQFFLTFTSTKIIRADKEACIRVSQSKFIMLVYSGGAMCVASFRHFGWIPWKFTWTEIIGADNEACLRVSQCRTLWSTSAVFSYGSPWRNDSYVYALEDVIYSLFFKRYKCSTYSFYGKLMRH